MKKKTYPPGHWMNFVPVDSGPAALQVNLTELSPHKKRPVWERIKRNSPSTAELLSSPDFREAVANVEAVFGPVSISVDLAVLGEENDGIS